MNQRIAVLRAEGMSKRQAKRAVYGRISRRIATAAPVAEYRRLSVLRRRPVPPGAGKGHT